MNNIQNKSNLFSFHYLSHCFIFYLTFLIRIPRIGFPIMTESSRRPPKSSEYWLQQRPFDESSKISFPLSKLSVIYIYIYSPVDGHLSRFIALHQFATKVGREAVMSPGFFARVAERGD